MLHETVRRIREERVVAVLRADSAEELQSITRALLDGGIRCLEFTMTTPGAMEMLRRVSTDLEDSILLGAGTILDAETARMAILAGAKFLVSPVVSGDVIGTGRRYGVPVAPGAFTPTEILAAWEAGGDLVKVFPAGRVGPGYVKDLRGPLPQIPLMPTGGVTVENAAEYLDAGAAVVGIGGNLTRKASGETDADLTERARRLLNSIGR